MDTQTNEGNWSEVPRTNSTRLVHNIGLDCVTVDPLQGAPYFFLFADVDSKDTELLRSVLQIYNIFHLSAYFWETTKGFHVCSPCLLTLKLWNKATRRLGRYTPNYSFLTLRWTIRADDGKQLFFEDYNKSQLLIESRSLHSLVSSRFLTKPVERGIETNLTYSFYRQLYIKKVAMLIQPSGSLGKKLYLHDLKFYPRVKRYIS